MKMLFPLAHGCRLVWLLFLQEMTVSTASNVSFVGTISMLWKVV